MSKPATSFMINKGKTCQGAFFPSEPEPGFLNAICSPLKKLVAMISITQILPPGIYYSMTNSLSCTRLFEVMIMHCTNLTDGTLYMFVVQQSFYHQYSHQCGAVNAKTDSCQRKSFANFKNIGFPLSCWIREKWNGKCFFFLLRFHKECGFYGNLWNYFHFFPFVFGEKIGTSDDWL